MPVAPAYAGSIRRSDALSEIFKVQDILDAEVPGIVIIDAGARIEDTPRYAALCRQRLATVVGFEPQAAEYEKLRGIADDAHRYFPHCLGKGGRSQFFVTRFPGCSSMYEPDPRVIDLFSTIGAGTPAGNFFVVRITEVDTTPLDELAEVPDPDFIKLDVQGAELDVLAGGEQKLARALVVESEVAFVPLYKNQPLFGDIQVFLSRRGFLLHKLIDVAGRGYAPLKPSHSPYAPFSQMLWADAVFIRDVSRLDRFSNEDLLKACVILHEVYRSIDLVAYLLRELDRRIGGRREAAYLAELQKCPRLPLQFLNIKTTP